MRRRQAFSFRVLLLLALATLVAAPAAGAAGQRTPVGVLGIDVDASRATVKRAHGSVFVTLHGVEPSLHVDTFTVKRQPGRDPKFSRARGDLKVTALGRRWDAGLGRSPDLRITGPAGRTTLFGITGEPVWNPRAKTLVFSANATPANASGATRSGQLGRGLTARILPTRAITHTRPRVATPSSRTTPNTCPSIQPSRANTSFCLSYDPSLGGGSQPWKNLLSGTMQTVSTCQPTPALSQIGGSTIISGEIDVYADAASAQAALSASMQVKYSVGAASASAKAGFSASSDSSASAVYAIAQVTMQNGVVNFGSPQLDQTHFSQAADIGWLGDALTFLTECGDSVPINYGVGATWISVMEIKTSSQTEAADLYASVKGSYAGVSASQSFKTAMSSTSESQSIDISDSCAGPSSCTVVPGYVDPATGDLNPTSAVTLFTNNYSEMLTNIAGACQPNQGMTNCMTTVQYSPIYTLAPGSGASSPSQLVDQAATGAFAVQTNFNGWATQYQALQTGYPSGYSTSEWATNQANLAATGPLCDVNGMSTDWDCSSQIEYCWDAIDYSLSMQSPDCLPSAFTDNDLFGIADPFTIDPDA